MKNKINDFIDLLLHNLVVYVIIVAIIAIIVSRYTKEDRIKSLEVRLQQMEKYIYMNNKEVSNINKKLDYLHESYYTKQGKKDAIYR